MQLLIYTAAPVHHGKVTWDPPLRVGQTDRQTCVKTLPSRTLHMRAVIMLLDFDGTTRGLHE